MQLISMRALRMMSDNMCFFTHQCQENTSICSLIMDWGGVHVKQIRGHGKCMCVLRGEGGKKDDG